MDYEEMIDKLAERFREEFLGYKPHIGFKNMSVMKKNDWRRLVRFVLGNIKETEEPIDFQI